MKRVNETRRSTDVCGDRVVSRETRPSVFPEVRTSSSSTGTTAEAAAVGAQEGPRRASRRSLRALGPAQVWAQLLDEGEHPISMRTMHRRLRMARACQTGDADRWRPLTATPTSSVAAKPMCSAKGRATSMFADLDPNGREPIENVAQVAAVSAVCAIRQRSKVRAVVSLGPTRG